MSQDLHGAVSAPAVPGRRAAGRKALFRRSLLAGLCAALGACASIVPGDRAYSLRGEQSEVKLPVKAGDAAEPVPANVAIKPITAELGGVSPIIIVPGLLKFDCPSSFEERSELRMPLRPLSETARAPPAKGIVWRIQ